MVNKRKRDELGDSDSDEVTLGRQILPVANLPYDFDQEPQDGMQYLFLVRRDARRLPHVTRVQNPYEVSETKVTKTFTPLPTSDLPCEEWRTAFQTHFSNLRKNLDQATICDDYDHVCSRRRLIPEKKDRDAWWEYLAGHSQSTWSPRSRSVRKKLGTTTCMRTGDTARLHLLNIHPYDLPQNIPRQLRAPDSLGNTEVDLSVPSEEVRKEHMEELSPPEVTPGHLREVDHRMSIHLLMYFTHWINVHLQNPSDLLAVLSVSHAQWMFALLTKVEDQLSADEMNLLRNLARACLGLVRRYRGEDAKNDAVRASDASWWMVFTAIAGYWGQRDLWADAEATLSNSYG